MVYLDLMKERDPRLAIAAASVAPIRDHPIENPSPTFAAAIGCRSRFISFSSEAVPSHRIPHGGRQPGQADAPDQPGEGIAQPARRKSLERAIMFARVIDDVPPIHAARAVALAPLRAKCAGVADADIPREVERKRHGEGKFV